MKNTRLVLMFLAWATACGTSWGAPGSPGHALASAAAAWLQGLDDALRAKAVFALEDGERQNWHFFPKARAGVPFREMTLPQRELARALLLAGLSEKGYQAATNIMLLEQVLRETEGPQSRNVREPENYYFSIFGKPAAQGTWAWRVEGHHLSINCTIINGRLFAVTPSFFGANPAEVKSGTAKGLRVLAAEEDLGRKLVTALDPEQRRKAVIAENAPADIITGAQRKVEPLSPEGIPGRELTETQRKILVELVQSYVHRHRAELAAQDWKRIEEAGWEKVSFAWAGKLERGQPHYYRVQGPTFLLEYDNTQNQANHAHSVWRDFKNDFGEDLLREHYHTHSH